MTTKKKIKIKVKKTKVTQSGNIVKVNINTRGGSSRPSGGSRPAASSGGRAVAPAAPSIIIQQPSQSQAQPNTQLLDMLQRAYAQNLENNQNFRKLNPANLNDVNNAVAIAQNSARQIVANTPEPDQVNRPPLPPLPPLRRPEVIQKPIQPQRLTGMSAVIDEIKRRQEQNTLLPPPESKFPIENETTQQAMFRIETGKIAPPDFRPFNPPPDILPATGGITRTPTPIGPVINRLDEVIANVQNLTGSNTPLSQARTEKNPPSAKNLSFPASPQSSVAASQSSQPLQPMADIRMGPDKEIALQTGVQVEGPRERTQTQFYGR